MSSKQRKRPLSTSATIAAAAFNLPVMVLAGVLIGYLLTVNQESPLREIIIIGITFVFFVLAIIELYYVAKKQEIPRYPTSSSSEGLIKLIKEEEGE